jgi:hypothetical protein
MTKEQYIKGLVESQMLQNPDAIAEFITNLVVLPADQKMMLVAGYIMQFGTEKMAEAQEALSEIEAKYAAQKAAEEAQLQLEQSFIADILQETQGELP